MKLKNIIPYCIHMHGKYHYVYETLEGTIPVTPLKC